MNQETKKHLASLETFHALIVSVLPATSRMPTRIKIFSPRFKDSVIIEYNGENGVSFEQGILHLESLGYNILGQADYNSGFIVISDTFKALTNQEPAPAPIPEPAPAPAQTEELTPEERPYNNAELSKHMTELNAKWMQLKRGLLHSIEPNTQNQKKRGNPWRMIIIDALAEVMGDNSKPSEYTLHIYHYQTEQAAEQDIEKINSGTENHGIFISSF